MEVQPHAKTHLHRRLGAQPVALAAAVLVLVVLGVGAAAAWRTYSGTLPEQERLTSLRQMQARSTQVSEQLVEKTRSLEASQQETIDQLQAVQDQLATVKRFLAAQQADNKRLSEQVGGLTGAIDTLRQSFASTQSSEPAPAPTSRKKAARSGPRVSAGPRPKRAKSRS